MTAPSDEIVFRPFRPGDARALLRWTKTPDELLQWTGLRFRFPLDERQLAEYADTSGDHRHLISAVTRTTEIVVAHAELTVLPEHELGQIGRFAVAPEMRGRGIAGGLLDWLVAFAFDDLTLHRLELVAFSFNEPALRCYKRAGFREEGLARHARKASDGYWDLVHMGLLASWRSGPA
jgi:RimJ/RimL family protein N-acetyltransferase